MPDVWPYWIGQGTHGGTAMANVQIWQGWTQGTAGTTPITYSDPWCAWQAQQTPIITNSTAQTVWVNWQTVSNVNVGWTPPELTPEQEAAQKRRTLIQRNRTRACKLRRNIAGRKANQLLLEHLSDAQREEWLEKRSFHVETADGRRSYRIDYGLAGNVRLVKCEGDAPLKYGRPLREGARFCMHVYHPDGAVPNEDNVLAQKLLIESNEAHFLELANVS